MKLKRLRATKEIRRLNLNDVTLCDATPFAKRRLITVNATCLINVATLTHHFDLETIWKKVNACFSKA